MLRVESHPLRAGPPAIRKIREAELRKMRSQAELGNEKMLVQRLKLADARHVDTPQERSLAQAIKTKRPDDLLPENVAYRNSLQVLFSSRFVFSPKNDFDVAKKMIDKNPHLKSHPKWILT